MSGRAGPRWRSARSSPWRCCFPSALLGLDARAAGWSEIHRVLFRERSWHLLQHTVEISVLVVLFSAAIGVATAWCTERTRIPGRRAWTVLLVLPVAIPDFVVGYAWHSIDPTINGLFGATLVMTLGTYPLVYLPVAAALRRADPAMEDTAHSLGVGPVGTFCARHPPSHPHRRARWQRPRVPHGDLGVRRVRDPALPDLHDRDLHRVPIRLPGRGRAVGAARVPRPARARRGRDHPPTRHPLGADATRRRPSADAPSRPADRGRAGGAGRARRGCAHRHPRVLDGAEPAHHAARRRHFGLGHGGDAHLQRPRCARRRRAGAARGHDGLPAHRVRPGSSSNAART